MVIILAWIALCILSYVAIRLMFHIDGTKWRLKDRCIVMFWSLFGPWTFAIIVLLYIIYGTIRLCEYLEKVDFHKEVKW